MEGVMRILTSSNGPFTVKELRGLAQIIRNSGFALGEDTDALLAKLVLMLNTTTTDSQPAALGLEILAQLARHEENMAIVTESVQLLDSKFEQFFEEQERWEALSPGSSSGVLSWMLTLLFRISGFSIGGAHILEVCKQNIKAALSGLTAVFRQPADRSVLLAALRALYDLTLPDTFFVVGEAGDVGIDVLTRRFTCALGEVCAALIALPTLQAAAMAVADTLTAGHGQECAQYLLAAINSLLQFSSAHSAQLRKLIRADADVLAKVVQPLLRELVSNPLGSSGDEVQRVTMRLITALKTGADICAHVRAARSALRDGNITEQLLQHDALRVRVDIISTLVLYNVSIGFSGETERDTSYNKALAERTTAALQSAFKALSEGDRQQVGKRLQQERDIPIVRTSFSYEQLRFAFLGGAPAKKPIVAPLDAKQRKKEKRKAKRSQEAARRVPHSSAAPTSPTTALGQALGQARGQGDIAPTAGGGKRRKRLSKKRRERLARGQRARELLIAQHSAAVRKGLSVPDPPPPPLDTVDDECSTDSGEEDEDDGITYHVEPARALPVVQVQPKIVSVGPRVVQVQRKQAEDDDLSPATSFVVNAEADNDSDSDADQDIDLALVPRRFLCEYGKHLMSDPVISIYGDVFDRATVEDYIEANNNKCPITAKPLRIWDLIADDNLRAEIAEFRLQRAVSKK